MRDHTLKPQNIAKNHHFNGCIAVNFGSVSRAIHSDNKAPFQVR